MANCQCDDMVSVVSGYVEIESDALIKKNLLNVGDA